MRILSIDGGGIRGIIPALVLEALEARTGRPTATLFDLIAGTSTGAILACALAKPDPRPASELVGLYRDHGPSIFRRSLGQRIRSLDGLIDEKHDAHGLEAALAGELGNTLLSAATTDVLVTSYDLEAREPYFFKSWRADRDAPMRIVTRAASAAPTYFEPVKLGERTLVDGGVFANNPSMCAFAEARRLTGTDPEFLVSLGTGRHTDAIHYRDAKGWGLLEWARPVIDVVFDGVADTVEYEVNRLMPEADHTRFQLTLRLASDALDDASATNIRHLEEQAEALIQASATQLDRVAERLTA